MRALVAGFAMTAVLAVGLSGQPVFASDTDINSMLSGDSGVPGVTPAPETPTLETPATTPAPLTESETLPGSTPSAFTAPSAPASDVPTRDVTVRPDAWLKSKNPMDHLKVIAAAPLDGETCQNVIFDARPYLPTRYEPSAGGNLQFSMKDLCLVGFRNDSDARNLVIRLGENFSTLAITADPQLFTGLEIAPGQQVLVALRPLPVQRLDVGIEAVWEDELDTLSPKVERATLTVQQ